jgi:maltose alpha-D-glucosyltransferase/alpha-amylase
MERLIRRRKETPELGFGSCTVFDCRDGKILAHACDWSARIVIALHNFSDKPGTANLEGQVDDKVVAIEELWSDTVYAAPKADKVEVGPYGYRWLRLIKRGQELML